MDSPLQNPKLEQFTDGSSFIQDEQHKAGSAITTPDKIVKAEALLRGWSPLQAELWAFAQAIHGMPKGKESTSILKQVCLCYFTCTWSHL